MKTQKRLAAKILKCGETRVWIDPESEDVASAMTRGDVRKFIGLGLIKARPKKGNSRGRIRKRKMQRKKGRSKGFGKRTGAKKARFSKKERWMRKIRAQRNLMRKLRDEKKIDSATYRKTYALAKAGTFKDKAHLSSYLKEQKK